MCYVKYKEPQPEDLKSVRCIHFLRQSERFSFSLSLSLYIYIYIHVCVCACEIKYYRHPLSTYFYFDPSKSLYGCHNIRLELTDKFSVIDWSPSTFGLLLSHHQWEGEVYMAETQYSVLFIPVSLFSLFSNLVL